MSAMAILGGCLFWWGALKEIGPDWVANVAFFTGFVLMVAACFVGAP